VGNGGPDVIGSTDFGYRHCPLGKDFTAAMPLIPNSVGAAERTFSRRFKSLAAAALPTRCFKLTGTRSKQHFVNRPTDDRFMVVRSAPKPTTAVVGIGPGTDVWCP
jgi:hypothetical protein